MTYTEDEICDLYEHAKDKQEQFRILLDLTRADKETLTEILLTHGLIKPTKAKCPRCGHDFDRVLDQRICSRCESEIKDLRLQLKSKHALKYIRKAQAKVADARIDVEIAEIKKRIRKKEDT